MEQKRKDYNIKNIFINMLLKNGKKNISEYFYNNILIELLKKTKQKPFFILIKTINNLLPALKLINIPFGRRRKRNKKKKKYFLIFLNKEKQIKNSIRLLLLFSKKKKTNFLKNITIEIINTFNKKSKSILKKQEIYKEINKLRYNIKY
jgi:ribosomal protein S7